MSSDTTPAVVHDIGAGAFLDPVPAAVGPTITVNDAGVPLVARNGALVHVVQARYGAGVGAEELATEYGLTLDEVFAAVGHGRPAPEVVVDGRWSFGAPVLARTKTPVDAVVGMFRAGEPLAVCADKYGLTLDEVEATLRYRLPSVDDGDG